MYMPIAEAAQFTPSGGCARIGTFGRPWELCYEQDALLIVGGLPGAGKTWLLERATLGAEVVSAEAEIIRRFGPAPAWELISFSDAIGWAIERIEEGLTEGRPMILESVALFEGPRSSARHVAAFHERPAHILYLQCPPGVARRGQWTRRRVLPENIWRSYERASREPQSPEHGPEGLLRREDWTSVTVIDREAAEELSAITFSGRSQ